MIRSTPAATFTITLAITLLAAASGSMAGKSDEPDSQEAQEASCEALPPTFNFGLPAGGQVTGMSIMAGCDGPGWHAFVMEVLPEAAGAPREIQVRFVPPSDGGAGKLSWLGKKLLRIKGAESAVGMALAGKEPAWALFYAKGTGDEERVPTLAVITADGAKKGFKTKTVKFEGAERFFSPLMFVRKEALGLLWGEEKSGAHQILFAAVDRDTMQGQAATLVKGEMLDRFQALLTGTRITVARLRAQAGSPDATEAVIEAFGLDGKSQGSVTATGLEADVALTGIRIKGEETVVEGMEARQGRWRPFEITVDGGFGKAEVSRKGKPAIAYSAGFAALSDVILWKNKHEHSAVALEFFGKSYTVSQEGAAMPLALSLCSSSAVGAWIHEAAGIGGVVRYFDIELQDSDGDGALDAFDACDGDAAAPEMQPGG